MDEIQFVVITIDDKLDLFVILWDDYHLADVLAAGNKTAYTTKQVVTSDITAPVFSVGTISTTGITATEVTLNLTKATDTVSAPSALQYQVY